MVRNRLTGRLLLFLVFSVLSCVYGSAEDTFTRIFDSGFKTLQTSVNGNLLTPPILNMGVGDVLTVEFDEIAEDRRFLRYSIVSCNADWSVSGLVESEYVDGFNIADVTDYEFSEGTVVHYVHYRISFPDENLRVTRSGNYLLRVFDEGDPDAVLLQVRFYVSEGCAVVSADVTSRTDIDYNGSHQQVSLGVDCSKAGVQNVYTDLRVTVLQNSRYDNCVNLTVPTRVAGGRVFYEHLRSLVFPAGNEYRRFECVSVNYPGMGVESVDYYHPYYHAVLYTDIPRADEGYVFDKTQFGRYVVREYDSDRSEIEADYVAVHFSLDAPHYAGCDVFLDGDFVCRGFTSESQMVFNSATGLYEKTLLLKQGAYNYEYLAVDKGVSSGNAGLIEGDKYQTVNEYTVLVYTRRHGDRCDRLIGAAVVYSNY